MTEKLADYRDIGDMLLDTAVPLLSGIISREKLEKALRKGKPQEGWSHRQVAVRNLPLEKLKFEKTRLALPSPGERLFTPTWRSGRLHAHRTGSLFLVHEDGVAPQDGLCATAKHLLHDVPPALKMLAKPPLPLAVLKKNVEQEKAAEASDVVLGAGLLLATALVASDLYQSAGMGKDQKVLLDALSGKTHPVTDVSAYVAKADPKIVVVDTPEKLEKFLNAEVPDGIKRRVNRAVLLTALTEGNNAFAFRGSKDYIIGKGSLPVEVIEHEMGHIADFREKGIKTEGSSMGGYQTGILHALHQQISKAAYTKGRYAAEVAAWEKAKETPHKAEIQKAALATYDKAFHANRAALVGSTALWLGTGHLMSKMGSALDPFLSKEKKKSLKQTNAFFKETDKDKKWGAFSEEVARKSFLKTLSTDPRADEKLRLHADRMNRLKTGKVVGKAPGSVGTYDIVKLRGGGLGCTCADWRFKRSVAKEDALDCKHLKSFKAHAGEDA